MLIITKVEYPDELDTRFSKFSEADDEDVYKRQSIHSYLEEITEL